MPTEVQIFKDGTIAPAVNNGVFPSTTAATGGDNYHENRPPYYAIAFIMRTV